MHIILCEMGRFKNGIVGLLSALSIFEPFSNRFLP
jgi:hypothetical protein